MKIRGKERGRRKMSEGKRKIKGKEKDDGVYEMNGDGGDELR